MASIDVPGSLIPGDIAFTAISISFIKPLIPSLPEWRFLEILKQNNNALIASSDNCLDTFAITSPCQIC